MDAYGLLPPLRPLRRAVLGQVTWNLREVGAEAAAALLKEANDLRAAGVDARVIIVDSGSDDGTPDLIAQAAADHDAPFELIRRARNEGVSIARNVIIDRALEIDADRLLLMDGDVEIVPGSVLELERVFRAEKNETAVVGLELADGVVDRDLVPDRCPDLTALPRQPLQRRCGPHYSWWRMEAFADGDRFETAGGMGEAGWGHQDFEMFLQLTARGLKAMAVGGVPHLHRNRQHSIAELERRGVDVAAVLKRRADVVRDKWAEHPVFQPYRRAMALPLEAVRAAVPGASTRTPKGPVLVHLIAETDGAPAVRIAENEIAALRAVGCETHLRVSFGRLNDEPTATRVAQDRLTGAAARNAAIAEARARDCTHIVFITDRVRLPDGAFASFLAALDNQPPSVAALTAHPSGARPAESALAPLRVLPPGLLRIAERELDPDCLFLRRAALEAGFRFEDRGPFEAGGDALAAEAAALRLKALGLSARTALCTPHHRRRTRPRPDDGAREARLAALRAFWANDPDARLLLERLDDDRTVRLKPAGPPPRGRRVLLFTLTWNMKAVNVESAAALFAEARRLNAAGHEAEILIWDSGSTDGTREAVERIAAACADVRADLRLRPTNEGNARPRNAMIDKVCAEGFDYAFHVDGDVETIPRSVAALIAMFERLPEDAAVLGLHIQGSVSHRAQALKALDTVPDRSVRRSEWLPHTHYGLTAKRVYDAGLRFEETGPFGGPGYGLEDVDFALQMLAAGLRPYHVEGVPTLHRHFRSSVSELVKQGVDVEENWLARRARLIEKWRDVPAVAETVLPKLLKTKPPFVRALPD